MWSQFNMPNRTYSSSFNPYNTTGNPMQIAAGAWGAARQANESRYRDILGGYQQRYNSAVGDLDKLAGSSREDLNRNYDNLLESNLTDLSSRGLANTTVRQSMRTSNTRERGQASNRLEAMLAQQRLGIAGQFSKQMLDFMERRNDGFPDPAAIARMGQQYGGRQQPVYRPTNWRWRGHGSGYTGLN